jgi:hypothetical protein
MRAGWDSMEPRIERSVLVVDVHVLARHRDGGLRQMAPIGQPYSGLL